MPNKINRGPEIYDPQALRSEYSRQEREKMTHFVNGRRPKTRSKYSIRILMMDILLLCIIGGVITPFIINRNKTARIEGINCKLEIRSSEEEVFISVILMNSNDGAGPRPVETEIYINDVFQSRLEDLTPEPGGERTLRLKMKRPEERISIRAVVNIDGKKALMNDALGPGG